MNQIYSIWCEWDIGQEGNFFENEQEALDFGYHLWQSLNMDEEVGKTLNQAIDDGLFSIVVGRIRETE